MDRTQIEEKIKEILANKLNIGIDKITPQSSLRQDLGMDSFASVEIIFEIEDFFNINVSQEDIPAINTFADMVDQVAKYLAAGTKK